MSGELTPPGGTGAASANPYASRSVKRLNRLRARVAMSLLKHGEGRPAEDAVAFLSEIVAGKHKVDDRVRTAAAAALLRTTATLVGAARVQVDNRSVHLHPAGPAKGIDRAAYQGLLEDAKTRGAALDLLEAVAGPPPAERSEPPAEAAPASPPFDVQAVPENGTGQVTAEDDPGTLAP